MSTFYHICHIDSNSEMWTPITSGVINLSYPVCRSNKPFVIHDAFSCKYIQYYTHQWETCCNFRLKSTFTT